MLDHTAVAAVEPSPGATAEVAAEFAATLDGQTCLTRQYHRAPLKIAKPFPQPDGSLHVIVMDSSPGMLEGDAYELNWRIGANARASVFNQSFTKVHPSGLSGSRLLQRVEVEQDGGLRLCPEPVMLYGGADYQAWTEVRLAAGASLFMTDILCAGRRLRGESFHFRQYDSALRVHVGEELIYAGRQRLRPQTHPFLPASSAGWDGNGCFGALYLFSDSLPLPELERLLEDGLEEARYPGVRFGASLTYKHGLALMALAASVEPVQSLFADASKLLPF